MSAFQPVQTIIPGLYQIALPTPYAVGNVNVFLAEGDPLTLIDCGVQSDASYEALSSALNSLGYQIKDIRRLIITHHHADHMGLAALIAGQSEAEVWCHPFGVRWLERPRESLKAERRYTDMLFRENGVPSAALETIGAFWRALETQNTPVRVYMTLDEGEWVEIAGKLWQVYYTPGHAGDLICFYQAHSGVLLSSDHLLRDISSNPLIEAPRRYGEARPKRLLEYLHEMRRIAQLDVKIAYTGHGEPIYDVATLVNGRLGFHDKRADKLDAMLSDGQPRTLYEISRQMFPNIKDAQMFLTLSEAQGHLDLLESQGRAALRSVNGINHWSLTSRPARAS
ncbi:MAG: MBL fold metallo-hydrolase [Anaerolinea sp.]|nr:MBL fold metallo-hydrolase [Anaerolinea sp.]CAG0956417.1 hypothetical protein ANRL4_00400 [Anaerolineae bacterium]